MGLLSTHWQVKPGPGVGARLLAGRAGSWSLAAGPGDPRAGVRSLLGVGQGGWFHPQSGLGSRVSQRLHWLACGQGLGLVPGQGPACLVGHGLLASDVCHLRAFPVAQW